MKLTGICVLLGLIVTSPVTAQANEVPDSLVVVEELPGTRPYIADGQPQRERCGMRVRDPVSEAEFILRRSEERMVPGPEPHYETVGFYSPIGADPFGLGDREWLRVDCSTNRPTGRVERAA